MVGPEPGALAAELAALDARHLRRARRVLERFAEPDDATRAQVDGQLLINFCGNDYLGLSRHPALIAAARAALERYGLGAGAAHLVSGHSREHQALEEELAAFTGRSRALLFSTGYMANLGTISALVERPDLVLADRLCHASLLDGARLSGARWHRYAHADARALARRLDAERERRTHPGAVTLIATDGLFSMDGDVAPVGALAALAASARAWLLVDDAHGLGVLGASGRGTLEQAGVDERAVALLVGTLGKALGTFGAFVAGPADLIDYVLQRARTYLYTTAPPPALAAATRAALRLVTAESWRRERLAALVRRFRTGAQALGLPLAESHTPIQPLMVGTASGALELSEKLRREGFWVTAIRPPTVPRGSARLRITLSAAHREQDVDALLERLAVHCTPGTRLSGLPAGLAAQPTADP